MITKLQDHLQKSNLLKPKSSLIVAVSGGVDSVALLDLLARLQPIWQWQLAVAHLNHKTRPESDQDAELVASLANKYNLPFYLGQLDGKSRSEATLRKKRYQFLGEVADGVRADFIVTAHHSDDRLETSIFNTIRGADREGMTAMKPLRDQLARPLLPFSKGQLITYAHINELPFNSDSSNNDVGYSRNFVRHELLPHATLLMPNFREEYGGRLDRLEALNQRINTQLEQVFELVKISESSSRIVLRRTSILKLPHTVAINFLAFVSRRLQAGIGLTSGNLNEALKFLFTARTGSSSSVLPGLQLERRYDTFIITFASTPNQVRSEPSSQLLSAGKMARVSDLVLRLNESLIDTDAEYIFIAPQSVYVRSWQDGDRVYPIGMNGSKKLQDIFVDKKVARSLRSRWPVVVSAENEVIWLPGLVRDRRFVRENPNGNYQLICEVV